MSGGGDERGATGRAGSQEVSGDVGAMLADVVIVREHGLDAQHEHESGHIAYVGNFLHSANAAA
jgi:hypothetical protein